MGVLFFGSVEEFDSCIEPSSLFATFDFPPLPEEVTRIGEFETWRSWGHTGLQMWYNGDRDVVKTVVRESVAHGWELTEIRSEKEFHGGGFRQVIR